MPFRPGLQPGAVFFWKGREAMICRFTLSPMSDGFVDLILGAIGKVDAGSITQRTDKLSTVYRGNREAVEDAVKACFLYAYRPHVHMTMECAFTADGAETGPMGAPLPNAAAGELHFPAVAKLTLYPLGAVDVAARRAGVVARAWAMDLVREEAFDGPILAGDVQDIFACLGAVNETCRRELKDYTLAFTLSVNSPTPD